MLKSQLSRKSPHLNLAVFFAGLIRVQFFRACARRNLCYIYHCYHLVGVVAIPHLSDPKFVRILI